MREHHVLYLAVGGYLVMAVGGYVNLLVGWAAVIAWVYEHETLAGGFMALASAILAAWFLSRQIGQAERHERDRFRRRREAARAMLPLALSSISDYAERSALAGKSLLDQCVDGALEGGPDLNVPVLPLLPTDALFALKEMIELSSRGETATIAKIATVIQYQYSRLSSLVADATHPPANNIIIIQSINIETYIIDAAIIYARVEALFDFGRRRTDNIPEGVAWRRVNSALNLMRFYDYGYETLYQSVLDRAHGDLDNFIAD